MDWPITHEVSTGPGCLLGSIPRVSVTYHKGLDGEDSSVGTRIESLGQHQNVRKSPKGLNSKDPGDQRHALNRWSWLSTGKKRVSV